MLNSKVELMLSVLDISALNDGNLWQRATQSLLIERPDRRKLK